MQMKWPIYYQKTMLVFKYRVHYFFLKLILFHFLFISVFMPIISYLETVRSLMEGKNHAKKLSID